MNCVLRELRIRPLIGGILSYIPGLYRWWDGLRPTGNTASAEYSRSIWKFHFGNLKKHKNESVPSVVVELGPGASLGTCMSALLDGVDKAIGLDVCPYAESADINLRILKELLPHKNNELLYESLVADINDLGTNRDGVRLKFVAPWTDIQALQEGSIDFIFSHSVLEHVTFPDDAYRACFKWLKPGGLMSHKIDHSAHAITQSWNGHYAIPSWLWGLLRGRKPYLLNRLSVTEHRALILQAGFVILSEDYVVATGLDKSSRCEAVVGNPDLQVKTSTFVCKKP